MSDCGLAASSSSHWHLDVTNMRKKCRLKTSCTPAMAWALLLLCASVAAQNTASINVPKLIRFSSSATDASGELAGHVAGITFCLYEQETDDAPIWAETQNVQLDTSGRYTVLLGATKSEGVPLELFTSGEARWLGVRVEGRVEQKRVLLLSVPYALKAADAETVGGLPPSAFVRASLSDAASSGAATKSGATDSQTLLAPITGSGTPGYLSVWTSATNLGNSLAYQADGTLYVNGTVSGVSGFFSNGSNAGWLQLEGYWDGNNYIESFNNTKSGSQNLAITGADATPMAQMFVAAR
jgi:hypothetical protein